MKAFTENKNSKFTWLVMGLSALLLLSSCGGEKATISSTLGGGTPSPYDYFVDAVNGDNLNDGSEATPFKTITQAMTVALSAESVKVLPGLYDAALGEANPIVVPAGVTVIGDEANKGNGVPATKFSGVTIQPGSNAVVAGLWGDAPATNGFVLDTATGITIRNNTVTGASDAVLIQNGSANNVIQGNNLSNNTNAGVSAPATAGIGTRFVANTITNNLVGLEIAGDVGDLGGGGAGSTGGNIISCNTNTDFWTSTAGTVSMQNNYWDHGSPSNLTTAGGGIDTYSAGGTATLDTTGSMLAVTTPCTYDYFVDAVSGDDTFDGSEATPFKTIMTAMFAAVSGNFVKVQPGLYDAALGEASLIIVPAGVTVIGDEPGKGQGGGGTIIDLAGGADSAGFVSIVEMNSSATLAGLTLKDGTNTTEQFVSIYASSATLRNNTFLGNVVTSFGIQISEAAPVGNVIVDNNISGFTNPGSYGMGIIVVSGGDLTKVEGNKITGNSWGIGWLSTGSALDMGGGAAGSLGGNVFSCNIKNDLAAYAAIAMSAQNNYWDHATPTQESTMTNAGVDLYITGAGSFDTTGAMVAAGACP